MEADNQDAGEAIGHFAVSVFKRRCETNPRFMEEPAIVMQMTFNEMFNKTQKVETTQHHERRGKS